MPYIQINGNRTLTDPELVHGNGRIICQPDPADYTACCPFKTADGTSARTHFSKIHPHTAAEFADLCKIINASVDPVQTIRHRINKAGGKLVVRFSRI